MLTLRVPLSARVLRRFDMAWPRVSECPTVVCLPWNQESIRDPETSKAKIMLTFRGARDALAVYGSTTLPMRIYHSPKVPRRNRLLHLFGPLAQDLLSFDLWHVPQSAQTHAAVRGIIGSKPFTHTSLYRPRRCTCSQGDTLGLLPHHSRPLPNRSSYVGVQRVR